MEEELVEILSKKRKTSVYIRPPHCVHTPGLSLEKRGDRGKNKTYEKRTEWKQNYAPKTSFFYFLGLNCIATINNTERFSSILSLVNRSPSVNKSQEKEDDDGAVRRLHDRKDFFFFFFN